MHIPIKLIDLNVCPITRRTNYVVRGAIAYDGAAWLCQEYGMSVSNIISHKEGARMGIASSHGDPENWMVLFGDSMDLFRADVSRMLGGGVAPAAQHYIGTVKTKTGKGINIRMEPTSGGTIAGTVKDGEKVEVIGNNAIGNYAPVKFFNPEKPSDAYYVDTQYLVDRVDVDESEPEVPEDTLYRVTASPVSAAVKARLLEVWPGTLVEEVG